MAARVNDWDKGWMALSQNTTISADLAHIDTSCQWCYFLHHSPLKNVKDKSHQCG